MPPSANPDTERSAAFIARAIGPILAVCGGIGLLAAFTLAIEKFKIVEDPTYIPTCSINPILSCGSVMTTDQAEAFGFPNPLLGIAGFAAVAALGCAMIAGAQLARWLWLALQVGLTFAVIFVHWLFFQSLYEIEALCPYCMVVWVVTIVGFFYCTLCNLAHGPLPASARLRGVVSLVVRYHGVVLTLWFGLLVLLIGEAFWDYWRTLP